MTIDKSSLDLKSLPAVKVDLLIIFLLWCASLIVANPLGNFPLNDDWAYASTVKHLLEYREYRPSGWAGMQLITNVLWGSLFCIPTGFSFNVLRLSTLVASIIGVGGVYWLVRAELRMPRWLSIVAALTLGFNPIYYALSNTFMTDVLYTTLQLFAAIFFLRNLKDGSNKDLLIATAFALAATLSRQMGVAVPLAFAVSLILLRGITVRNLLSAIIPVAICMGALLALQQWLSITGRLSAQYYLTTDFLLQMLAVPKLLLLALIVNSYVASLYFGLFLLPILIIVVGNIWRMDKWRTLFSLLMAGAIAVGGAGIVFGSGFRMPVMGNLLVKSGIGPLTLRDADILHLNNLPELSGNFWLVVTIASLVGSALLQMAVMSAIGRIKILKPSALAGNALTGTFLLLITAIYLLPVLAGVPADRYLIPVVPLFIVGILSLYPPSQADNKVFSIVGLAVVVSFSCFATLATKDYLAWNRARWEALQDLQKDSAITVRDIDGGFEFNGLYAFDAEYQRTPDKSWWWVQDDTYLIGFQPLYGYTVLKEYPYPHWLPFYTGKIVTLKKISM